MRHRTHTTLALHDFGISQDFYLFQRFRDRNPCSLRGAWPLLDFAFPNFATPLRLLAKYAFRKFSASYCGAVRKKKGVCLFRRQSALLVGSEPPICAKSLLRVRHNQASHFYQNDSCVFHVSASPSRDAEVCVTLRSMSKAKDCVCDCSAPSVDALLLESALAQRQGHFFSCLRTLCKGSPLLRPTP